MRIAVIAAVVALAVLAGVFAVRLLTGTLNLMRGGETQHDPQFAQPAEAVTRPPELEGEEGALDLADDPSAGWDLGEQTPVDKTAEELSLEAANGGA